jgi:ferredoxin
VLTTAPTRRRTRRERCVSGDEPVANCDMATIITSECINCGACEPECPNTAIYQGGVEYELDGKQHPSLQSEIFYIVAEKCTECVGFYDYEACAAVCPVDCCVTDPDRPESEEALLVRAQHLHSGKDFGSEFPSRFNPGRGVASAKQPAPSDAPPEVLSSAAKAPATVAPAASVESAPLDLDSLEIPVSCRTCAGEFAVAFRFFQPGLVLRCPHCGLNFTPSQRLFLGVADRLERFARETNASIDAYHALIESAQVELEDSVAELRERLIFELRRLVAERTEPRKAGIFG